MLGMTFGDMRHGKLNVKRLIS